MDNRYFRYCQVDGELTQAVSAPGSAKPVFVGTGYSGHGPYRNVASSESLNGLGVLPRGWYTIRAPVNSPRLGPCVMVLVPDQDNEMFGRGGFCIHGDNARHDASEGCIILGPVIRGLIAQSGIHRLQVF